MGAGVLGALRGRMIKLLAVAVLAVAVVAMLPPVAGGPDRRQATGRLA